MRSKASIAIVMFCFLCLSPRGYAESNFRVVRWLASPAGVAVVASLYGLAAGSSNIAWALDWTRFGYSDERSKRIQEANGIAVGAETIVFCGFFPFWAYQYSTHYSPAALAAKAATTVLTGTAVGP